MTDPVCTLSHPVYPEEGCIAHCPVCGAELYGAEKIYKSGWNVIGCEHCIDETTAEMEF